MDGKNIIDPKIAKVVWRWGTVPVSFAVVAFGRSLLYKSEALSEATGAVLYSVAAGAITLAVAVLAIWIFITGRTFIKFRKNRLSMGKFYALNGHQKNFLIARSNTGTRFFDVNSDQEQQMWFEELVDAGWVYNEMPMMRAAANHPHPYAISKSALSILNKAKASR